MNRIAPKCLYCPGIIYTSPEFSWAHMEHNIYTEPEFWVCAACHEEKMTPFQARLYRKPSRYTIMGSEVPCESKNQPLVWHHADPDERRYE